MSRLYRQGVVLVLALFALACNNGDDSGTGTPNQPPSFNNTVVMLASPADGSGDDLSYLADRGQGRLRV
jgi:hypothetical protein